MFLKFGFFAPDCVIQKQPDNKILIMHTLYIEDCRMNPKCKVNILFYEEKMVMDWLSYIVLWVFFLEDKIRNIQVIENYFLFLLINHDNKMYFST